MRTIHIASPSGVQVEYEESQVFVMSSQGLIENGSQYWCEGMPEWRPIEELTGNRMDGGPSTQSAAYPQGYSFVSDPKSLTRILLILLWISLGMEILSIVSDSAQMSLLSAPFTEEDAMANDARQQQVGLLYLGVFIVTGITFLRWIHRANKNCRGFGANDMEFSPGWSVGCYFVPFINLVRPYQAMKEIWQVSHNPVNWKSQAAGATLSLWWTLWLVSGVLGQIAFRTAMSADTVEKLKSSTIASIISSIVGILLCLVAISLIKTIAKKQEQVVLGG